MTILVAVILAGAEDTLKTIKLLNGAPHAACSLRKQRGDRIEWRLKWCVVEEVRRRRRRTGSSQKGQIQAAVELHTAR